jgi:hypothetical protein
MAEGAGSGEQPVVEGRGRYDAGQHDPEGSQPKELLSPAKKRRAVDWVREQLSASERRVCRVLHQPRSTQRQEPVISEEEERLRERIVDLACSYGRYGYRRITGLLRNEGWQ